MADQPIHLGEGVFQIDTDLRGAPGAAYLVVGDRRAAFVDVGPGRATENLLACLSFAGVARHAVDYVVLTHVHLDHAGAAGALLARLPDARLIVHPSGAPHMMDPTRLWAGAAAVYGESALIEEHERLVPAPRERVSEAADGERLALGRRVLELVHTPGHARHHLCVFDPQSSGLFTGDTFGLSYPDSRPLIFPTTTPVQFEPEAWLASLDRLERYAPRRVYLTHYGVLDAPAAEFAHLRRLIGALADLALGCDGRADEAQRLRAGMRELLVAEGVRRGSALGAQALVQRYAADIELNAQGLEVWLARRRKAQADAAPPRAATRSKA